MIVEVDDEVHARTKLRLSLVETFVKAQSDIPDKSVPVCRKSHGTFRRTLLMQSRQDQSLEYVRYLKRARKRRISDFLLHECSPLFLMYDVAVNAIVVS